MITSSIKTIFRGSANRLFHSSQIVNSIPRNLDYDWDYDLQSVDHTNLIISNNTNQKHSKDIKKDLIQIYQLQLKNLCSLDNNMSIQQRNHQQLVNLLENNQHKINEINSILINNSKK